jgi:hypothetical protein
LQRGNGADQKAADKIAQDANSAQTPKAAFRCSYWLNYQPVAGQRGPSMYAAGPVSG